jgi:hypothetical protein
MCSLWSVQTNTEGEQTMTTKKNSDVESADADAARVETKNAEGPVAVTPYRATAIVNRRLAKENLLPIKAQLLYGYAKAERIPSHRHEGKLQINLDDLDEWLEKYVEGRHARNAKAGRQVADNEVATK